MSEAIRGPLARSIREQQHEDGGEPIIGPVSGFDMFLMDRYRHTESIGPVRDGKTPGGRLRWAGDDPTLFVVKP